MTEVDLVLLEFAKVLSEHLRSGDVCCRAGGEEFLIVLPDTDEYRATGIAERIRQHTGGLSLRYHGQSITLTSSFGVATQCGDVDIEDLLKKSDTALYKAKAQGKNQVCVTGEGAC